MTAALSVRTRRTADARLARLRERFGEFPVQTVTRIVDPEFFEAGVEAFERGHYGAAGARVVDDEGRILLLRESDAPDTWGLPAGGNEPSETLVETAERELWEEAGVDCEVTGIWRAVRKRFVLRDDPEQRGYLLEVFFTAERVGGEAGVYPERWDGENEEVLAVRWFVDLPENVFPVVTDPTAPPVV